ncbi:unnamed protein product [Zymoseptoria tritici ST99CH_3D1]|nr:unnamed protein product [Zymoseptoria tritici ST99CH_3D1]
MSPMIENAEMEPIAIVGMGMRFPGESHSSEEFWDLLQSGRDGWRTIPKDRFSTEGYYHPDQARAGSIFVKGSHFLSGEYEKGAKIIDAPFFGMTSAEVEGSDPQQLHMLEVSYEALENAGISASSTAGTDTSVFVGCFTRDWEARGGRDPYTGPFYAATGNGMSMLANRVSWFYDMRGPSMTVDTACSSSLYAVHLACQSLRTGESKMAIAGGTNMICDPCYMRDLTGMGFLSPDGRCHSFDHRANGYGRGDGIGAVVLKKLSKALADGDTIRAVVRNSGLGQDGRTPGITMPSPEAQADLIRQVYKAAGLDMDQTAYFEAHGTGTPIGDPYELSALGATFGATRTEANPLYVGSVKANIGHLEGCAGLAGLIKTVLVVEQGQIPPIADFEKVNPRLKLDEWKVALPTSLVPWPIAGVRRASVNCFGYGGANSHVIIDDAYHYLKSHGLTGHHQTLLGPLDTPEVSDGSDSGFSSGASSPGDDVEKELLQPKLLVVSTVDQAGLQRNAAALAKYVQDNQEQVENIEFLQNLAYTLSSRRSTFDHRSFVVARSASDLSQQLQAPLTKLRRGAKNNNTFFLFTGQGAQWATMGKSLMAFKTYRDSLQRAQTELKRLGCTWNLIEELSASKETSRIDQPEFSQPLCTALQLALVDLLAEWSLTPKSVVGHSSGEIAAAYTAGFLAHEQAIKVSYCRGLFSADVERRMGTTKGAMMAVALSEAEVQPYLAMVPPESVVVACVNSPDSVTLSGDETAIDVLEKKLQDLSIFARKLRVKTAYHSPHMRCIADDYLAAMHDIEVATTTPKATMFSSVTGGTILSAADVDASYWVKNMLGCVRFSDAVQALVTQPATTPGKAKTRRKLPVVYSAVVEIGPAEVLKGPLLQILNAVDGKLATSVPYTALLSRNVDAAHSALTAVGKLWGHGITVDIHKLNFQTEPASPLQSLACLPPYRWNHKYYEHTSAYAKTVLNREKPRTDLLGFVVDTASATEPRWHNYIRISEQPWLSDHRVQNNVLYPGAAMVVQAIEGARTLADPHKTLKAVEVRDIVFKKGLVIPSGDGFAETEIHLKPTSSHSTTETAWTFEVYSRNGDDPWNTMCTGTVSLLYNGDDFGEGAREWQSESALYDDIRKRACRVIKPKTFYKLFDDKMGLQYGPLHRNVTKAVSGFGEGHGVLTVPDTKSAMPSEFEYPHLIHPATLDAIFHLQALGYLHSLSGNETLVPISIDSIYVAADVTTAPGTELHGYSKGDQSGSGDTVGDIVLSDDAWEAPKVVVRRFLSRDISATSAASSDSGSRKCTRMDYIPLHQGDVQVTPEHSDDGEQAVIIEPETPLLKLDELVILHAFKESVELPLLVAELQARLASSCTTITTLHPESINFESIKGKVVLSLLEIEECYVDGWTEKQFSWLRDLASNAECILWVTRGADVGTAEGLRFASTTGLLRTIRVEKPQLRLFQLDLDGKEKISDDHSIDFIVDAFESSVLSSAKAVEQEFVQIGDKLCVPRLATDESFHAELQQGVASVPVEQTLESLDYPVRAVVSPDTHALHFIKDEGNDEPLADDGIEVQPSVVMLSSAEFTPGNTVGRDAVGIVTAIGAKVTEYSVGDKVIVCAKNSLRSRLRVSEGFVRPQPSFIADAVAVNLPSAITTAYLSVIELGKIKKGDSILITTESGSNTAAIILLSQYLGATLYASYNTAYERRWLVEHMGLEDDNVVQINRGDRFKQALFRRTGGRGVDLVVSSVADGAAHYTVNCLAPFGRCVSLGSGAVLSSSAALAQGVIVTNLDLDYLRETTPSEISRVYQTAWALAHQGIFHILPPKRNQDLSGFNGMTPLPENLSMPGGMAVNVDPKNVILAVPAPPPTLALDPEATYVLAGGLGGIGRSIAETMFAAGARNISFISRSGAKTEEAKTLLNSLRLRGCNAKAYPCDVSSQAAVAGFVQASLDRGEKIKGVVQAAMVLEDSVFDNMTFDQWTRSTQPKITGSWNLHTELPKDMDFFIMLSSMAGIIGNPGQANYSAAGTYQDALSVHRRKNGFNATTIDLGIVSDVGYIAENPEQFERLRYLKPLFISERDLRLLLSAAMLGTTRNGLPVPPQVVTGVGSELMQDGSIGSAMAADLKYTNLHGASGDDSANAGEDEQAQEALKACTSLAAATDVVEGVFAANIAKATGMEPEDVDMEKPMHSYGVDSLAAVEVRNMIFRKFRAEVSVFDLLSTMALRRLAIKVVASSKLPKSEVQMSAQEKAAESED